MKGYPISKLGQYFINLSDEIFLEIQNLSLNDRKVALNWGMKDYHLKCIVSC